MYSPGPKGPASNPWGSSLRKQNKQPTNYQPAANSNKNLTVKFLIFPKNRGEELSSQCRLDIKDKAKQIRFCNQITIGKADIPLLILHQQPTLEGVSKQMNIFRRDYRVEVSTSKWHPIFIHAIMAPEQMNQQESTEWLRDLISRNPHLTDLSSEFFLKIKSARFSQKSETWFASLLVHQAFYTALINGPGLYIGDGAVKWRDDIFIPKCYKCSLFGHNNLNCEKDPWCPHCGTLGHKLTDCRAFDKDKSIEEQQGGKCGLCEKKQQDHNHSDLDRTKCTSYLVALQEKFGPHIQQPRTHLQINYIKALFQTQTTTPGLPLPQPHSTTNPNSMEEVANTTAGVARKERDEEDQEVNRKKERTDAPNNH